MSSRHRSHHQHHRSSGAVVAPRLKKTSHGAHGRRSSTSSLPSRGASYGGRASGGGGGGGGYDDGASSVGSAGPATVSTTNTLSTTASPYLAANGGTRAPRNNLDPLQNADLERGKIIEVLEATDDNLYEAFQYAKTELAAAHRPAFRSEYLRLCVLVGVASNMAQAHDCDMQLGETRQATLRMLSVNFMDDAMRLLRFSGRVRRLLRQLVGVSNWSSRVADIFRSGPEGLRDLKQVSVLLQQLTKRFLRLRKLLDAPFPIATGAVLAATGADWGELSFGDLKEQALLLRDLRGNKHVQTFLKEAVDVTAEIRERLEAVHAAVLENITLLDRRRSMQRGLQEQVLASVVPQCEQVQRECATIVGFEADAHAKEGYAAAEEARRTKRRQRRREHKQRQQRQQQREQHEQQQQHGDAPGGGPTTVSYTHLTLPTIYSV